MLARPLAWQRPWGDARTGDIALVMCLWNRPERLAGILAMLDGQRTGRGIRLVLWNNAPENADHYARVIAGFTPSGAIRSLELHESAHNIGGIGRFVAQRDLVKAGYTGPFLMLDDDQDVAPSFVDDLLAAAADRSVSGVWAWTMGTSYWDREPVETDGAPADHIGTGGSVCDSRIVGDDSFFTALPARFLFIEDMWMSACATANGWRLSKADTPVTFVLEHLDQGHHIRGDKEQFYDWLARHRDRIPRLGS